MKTTLKLVTIVSYVETVNHVFSFPMQTELLVPEHVGVVHLVKSAVQACEALTAMRDNADHVVDITSDSFPEFRGLIDMFPSNTIRLATWRPMDPLRPPTSPPCVGDAVDAFGGVLHFDFSSVNNAYADDVITAYVPVAAKHEGELRITHPSGLPLRRLLSVLPVGITTLRLTGWVCAPKFLPAAIRSADLHASLRVLVLAAGGEGHRAAGTLFSNAMTDECFVNLLVSVATCQKLEALEIGSSTVKARLWVSPAGRALSTSVAELFPSFCTGKTLRAIKLFGLSFGGVDTRAPPMRPRVATVQDVAVLRDDLMALSAVIRVTAVRTLERADLDAALEARVAATRHRPRPVPSPASPQTPGSPCRLGVPPNAPVRGRATAHGQPRKRRRGSMQPLARVLFPGERFAAHQVVRK